MALTKDPNLEGSFYGGSAPSIQEMSNPPPLELFSYRVGHSSIMLQEGESSDSLGSYSSCSSLLPFLSDPGNSSSSTYSVLGHAGAAVMTSCSPSLPDRSGLSVFYRAAVSVPEPWGQSSASTASLLSFEHGGGEHEDDCAAAWMDAMHQGYQLGATSDCKRRTDTRLIHEQDCLEVKSRGGPSPGLKDRRKGQEQFGLIVYPAGAGPTAAATDGGLQERSAGAGQPGESQKRKHTDAGDMPSPKKQTTKRIKESKSSPTKDPQSIAAKNRRERISERLKILQDLVPNGTKVDLVTMLEKAISYVKFLQLQVKVLATDEFWPAQGGKAPDIGQVKEAIDAILSSQRDKETLALNTEWERSPSRLTRACYMHEKQMERKE